MEDGRMGRQIWGNYVADFGTKVQSARKGGKKQPPEKQG
jgi:hypothetical protein